MTVSSTTSRADYTGNGVTTLFTVPFYFLDNTHLKVLSTVISTGISTTLTLGTDYTVTGAGVSSGGSITTTVAPASTVKISILRNVPYTQLTHYVENDPFPAASHEMALDQLTMEAQQLGEQASRVLTFPQSDSSNSGTLPTAGARANKYLAFDSTGNPTVAGALPTQLYYGAYNSNPTTRPDGTAMQTGDIYYNTVAQAMYVYNGTTWQSITQTANFPYQLFSGNGSTTAFTMSSAPGSLGSIEVMISGVRQVNGVDFTWSSGTTLTFTSAPPTGTNNIFVRWINVQSIGVPGDGTVTTAKIVDGAVTTAKLADANVTPAKLDRAYAELAAAQSFTKAQRGAVVGLTDGATITPDFAAGNNFTVTLGGNRALANPTNIVAGQSGVIAVAQDGTGSRTLSYGSYFKFANGTAPTLTTTASAVDLIAYYVESSTRIDARFIGDVK